MIQKKNLSLCVDTVFTYLQFIPKGKVVTYKMVATNCGIANPRNVSWVLQQNTDPDNIPCYKVVRTDGSLASGYKFGGPKEQQQRLTADGVMFTNNGKVALGHFFEM